MIGPFVSSNQFDTEWRKRKYGEEGKNTHQEFSKVKNCDCLDMLVCGVAGISKRDSQKYGTQDFWTFCKILCGKIWLTCVHTTKAISRWALIANSSILYVLYVYIYVIIKEYHE